MASKHDKGILSGLFKSKTTNRHDQAILDNKLEYATLTGDLRQANRLLSQGAKASEDLLLVAVSKKWSRFSELFLNAGARPTKEMSNIAIRNNDPDTLKLLNDHLCPVSEDAKIWASLHATQDTKDVLSMLEKSSQPRPRPIL